MIHVYRLINNVSYESVYATIHEKSLPAIRRILLLSENGLEEPDVPCVIVDDLAHLVYMPNGDLWHVGGRAYFNPFYNYSDNSPAYIIWKELP